VSRRKPPNQLQTMAKSPPAAGGDDPPLLDVDAAYADAFRLIAALWRAAESEGRDPRNLVLEIKDERGRTLLSIPFTDFAASMDPN
jgi:hypothetical protein